MKTSVKLLLASLPFLFLPVVLQAQLDEQVPYQGDTLLTNPLQIREDGNGHVFMECDWQTMISMIRDLEERIAGEVGTDTIYGDYLMKELTGNRYYMRYECVVLRDSILSLQVAYDGVLTPRVTLDPAVVLSDISAALSASFTGSGVESSGFKWAEDALLTSPQSGSGTGATSPIADTLTVLNPGKVYYFTAYAVKGSEYFYGDTLPLLTLPGITTVAADDLTGVSATLNATYSADSLTGQGFVWGLQLDLSDGTSVSADTTAGSTAIEYALTGLTEDSTHYFSAYAMNASGTSYGDTLSFVPHVPPTMTITAAEVSDGESSSHASLFLTFTSSESTTDFVEADITVTNGSISGFSGLGTMYVATFTPDGAGACTINVTGGTFTDAAGNNNVAADEFNWTYSAPVAGEGCMDNSACNYDATATISGGCSYATLWYADADGDGAGATYDFVSACSQPTGYVATSGDTCPSDANKLSPGTCGCGNVDVDVDADGLCDTQDGCTDSSACNYTNPVATSCLTINSCGNCAPATTVTCGLQGACNYDPTGDCFSDDLCDFASCAGCMNPSACNYDATASISAPLTCTFPDYAWEDCAGNCLNDVDNNGICDEVDVQGCTDSNAINYNPNATVDNGTCFTVIVGCIIPSATNYDPAATVQGAPLANFCTFPSSVPVPWFLMTGPGCMDSHACNYDATATTSDGSCEYTSCGGCNVEDACNYDSSATYNNGSCDWTSCLGCMDSGACDYDATATIEDACDFDSCQGCTNSAATNYDSGATIDNNTCIIDGCTNASACNYDASATNNDGSCTYASAFYNCVGECNNDSDSDGICDELEVSGCPNTSACNYNASATNDDGSCTLPQTWYEDADGDGFGDSGSSTSACIAPAGYVANATDNCPANTNKTEPGTCGCGAPDTDTDSDGTPDCNDNCPNDPAKTEPGDCGCSIADTDSDSDGIADCNDNTSPTMSITASEVADGGSSSDASLSLTFTSSEITTNFAAADITVTNGSISGFTGSGTTYTATFTPTGYGACTINVAAGAFTDAAGNNNTASDEFNWTFVDTTPPTMTITATEVADGGSSSDASLSLTFTSSESTTNFAAADITVTNGSISGFAGSGTTYTATFTPTGYGACTINVAGSTFTDVAGNNNTASDEFNWTYLFPCGTSSVTFDGHDYATVQIGSQCWFKENLRTALYANGDPIPGNLPNGEWTSTTSGAQAIYNNLDANLTNYGRLYNWYAVADLRGLCPSGWHVPSDGEWTELTDYLGGEYVAGGKMKSSASDSPAWSGTNSSGFSGLPGGFRYSNGNFFNVGEFVHWWSSSPSDSNAWDRLLSFGNDYVYRGTNSQRFGFSVRCVTTTFSDPTPPTMTITASEVADGGSSSDASLSLTFTSSEITTNFDETDITVTNGSISGFTGSGTTYTATFTPAGDGACTINVAAGAFTDEYGNSNWAAAEFNWTYIAPPAVFTNCGDAIGYNGHNYATVQIGNQCWFKENLRTALYANGDSIPGNLTRAEWQAASGAQAIYSNNDANLITYGRLYNWYAVNDARGLCPSSWHVPTDSEFTTLTDYLGGEPVAGAQMKSSGSDTPSWNGTNISGFSGSPAGFRDRQGDFYQQGSNAGWWSSSLDASDGAWRRNVTSYSNNVLRYATYGTFQRSGYSVRCVRD